MTNPTKPFELHRLAGLGGTLVGAGWAGRVQQQLDAGELANEIDEHDRTPLGVLVQSGHCDADAAAVAAVLIRAGANPLAHDRPMGRAVADACIGGDARLAEAMATGVVNMEDTLKLRSETGETLLHALCADAPEGVAGFIGRTGWHRNGREMPAHWIHERDQSGQTPLHAMWAIGGVIYDRLEAGMDVDGYQAAWDGLAELIDAGADLLARDNEGVPAANRIVECVQMGFPVEGGDPLWARIQSIATREVMDHKTQLPNTGSRPKGRL